MFIAKSLGFFQPKYGLDLSKHKITSSFNGVKELAEEQSSNENNVNTGSNSGANEKVTKFVPMAENRKASLIITDNCNFELRIYEDEMKEYPYPHDMKYIVTGTIPSSLNGDCQITKFTYITSIIDDLTSSKDHCVAHVSTIDDKDRKNKAEDIEVVPITHKEGFLGLGSSTESNIMVPEGFLFMKVKSTDPNVLICEWKRFHRLWTVTTDGTDFLNREGLVQTIEFHKVDKNKLDAE